MRGEGQKRSLITEATAKLHILKKANTDTQKRTGLFKLKTTGGRTTGQVFTHKIV